VKVCLACQRRFARAGWRCPECGHEPAADGVPLFAPELAHLDEGFDADVVRRLAEIEPESFWFVARNRIIAWALGAYFPGARTFLEVGCGTGFVLSGLRDAFPGLELVGSDSSLAALELAGNRVDEMQLLQVDARRLPFEQEFAAVGSFDVIEHIDEDQQVLAQLFRALQPGGGLVLSVPQHRWLWSVADTCAHHTRRYSRPELIAKVTDAGFEVLRTTSFVALPLPAMALARLRCPPAADPR
jgi:SAM-dependent methyltransferase